MQPINNSCNRLKPLVPSQKTQALTTTTSTFKGINSPTSATAFGAIGMSPTNITDRRSALTENPIILFKDYISNDFSKFLALFSQESQQAASLANVEKLQKQLTEDVSTCLLNSKDELKKIIEQNEGKLLANSIEDVLEYSSSAENINIKMLNCIISNDFKLKKTLNLIMGNYMHSKGQNVVSTTDKTFIGLLLTFHCVFDPDRSFGKLSAIVSFLYAKATEDQKQKLVSFMILSQNVMSNAYADDPCKSKLLLEVLCLIEKGIKCDNNIQYLSDELSDEPDCDVDGPPGIRDDQDLITLFRDYKLTTARNNIKPITQAIIAEVQPSNHKTEDTIYKSRHEAKPLQSNVNSMQPEADKPTVPTLNLKENKQVLELPSGLCLSMSEEDYKLHPDIVEALKDQEKLDDTEKKIHKIIDETIYRKFPDLSISDLDKETVKKYPDSFIDKPNDNTVTIEEVYESGISQKPTDDYIDDNDVITSDANEAYFFNNLCIYNYKKQGSELHKIVSTMVLKTYNKLHNRDINPLINLLNYAEELESTQKTAQDKLDVLIKQAIKL